MPPASQARPASRFDSPQQEAFLNLWRAYDTLKALEDALFSPFDISAQQYNALRLLRRNHPGKLHTLALAGQLVSRAPDITRLIDRLEKRKLVARERPEENRRVVLVGITAAGLNLLTRLDPLVRECNLQQLGHLSPARLKTLVGLLRLARAPHEKKPPTKARPGKKGTHD
ncbi:MAG: MarR family transcriptional regulator [Gemmataceae bacterium]|nr:MarR family transcriptional regulator [Gemmataceae bacterium]